MKLSVDFAFEGFAIIKKYPVAVITWGIFALVAGLLSMVVLVAVSGPSLMALQAYENTTPADPTEVLTHLAGLTPGLLLSIVISFVGSAMLQCAVYRSVLKPETKSFAFLQVGADEFRQIAVLILWVLAFMVVYLLFVLLAAVVIGLAAAFGAKTNRVLGGILVVVLCIAAVLSFLYGLSRWSLAFVQSFATGKINIFGSFKLTKGNGWKLFAGYFLLTPLIIIISVFVYGLFYAVVIGFNFDFVSAFQKMMNPDTSSLQALLTPQFLIQMLVGALLNGPLYALMYGASAAAYKAITEG